MRSFRIRVSHLTAPACTPTSPRTGWLDDEVIQLRCWGSERVYRLPVDASSFLMGTAATCAIRVDDPSHYTSREHACLEREAGLWRIVDRSKNGLYIDGEPHGRSFLKPGMRIGLGARFTLIAESARTIALQAALARMRGWSAELADSLDWTVQNLRLAPSGKAIFTLCGEGDLVMAAQELHRLTLGEQGPLVVCSTGGRRRRPAGDGDDSDRDSDIGSSAKLVPRVSSVRDAVALARGGTICLDNRRLPKDLATMFELLRASGSPTQVFVLGKYVRKTEVFTARPFVIPPLSARAGELDRLIAEYEAEASRRLGIGALELTAAQRARIRDRCKTLSDLQKATLRLSALRRAGTLRGAAALLGMSTGSLAEWLQAQGLQGAHTTG